MYLEIISMLFPEDGHHGAGVATAMGILTMLFNISTFYLCYMTDR